MVLEELIGFQMCKLGEDAEKIVSVGQTIDQGILRWFGHVERMGDERMAKRVV